MSNITTLGQDSGAPTWVGAVKPIGDAITGIVGSVFGKPAGAGSTTVVVEGPKTPAWVLPVAIVGGSLLLLGGFAMTRKKRPRYSR